MEILYLNEVDSTHIYLKEYIKKNGFQNPLAVVTQNQTNGIGSRDNGWDGKNGNLFFSFVVHRSSLPADLSLQSASIYFSFLLKEFLKNKGSALWLKWPNDFYLDNKKIGGTITNLIGELLYCGIGLNLCFINEKYGYLDVDFDIQNDLKHYFEIVDQSIPWKQIFSNFSIEFQKSREFTTTVDDKKVLLEKAILNFDGSIELDNKKVFSLR